MGHSTACSLFDICLHLFLDRPVTTGKVIAVDEAHKVRTYVHVATELLQADVPTHGT